MKGDGATELVIGHNCPFPFPSPLARRGFLPKTTIECCKCSPWCLARSPSGKRFWYILSRCWGKTIRKLWYKLPVIDEIKPKYHIYRKIFGYCPNITVQHNYIIMPRRSRSAATYSDQIFPWTICRSVRRSVRASVCLSSALWKMANRIRMSFGIIGRTGSGMRLVVVFGDRSTG